MHYKINGKHDLSEYAHCFLPIGFTMTMGALYAMNKTPIPLDPNTIVSTRTVFPLAGRSHPMFFCFKRTGTYASSISNKS